MFRKHVRTLPVSASFCELILSKNVISSSYFWNNSSVSQLEELLRDEEERRHSVSEALLIAELLHFEEPLDVDSPAREPSNVPSSSSSRNLLQSECVWPMTKRVSFFDNTLASSSASSNTLPWHASPPMSSSVNSISNIVSRYKLLPKALWGESNPKRTFYKLAHDRRWRI